MTQDDMPAFAGMLGTMLEVLSHGRTSPSPMVTSMWFEALRPYTLAQVSAGMTGHMRNPTTGRTLPIPADIVAQIEGAGADDGRLGGNEAWSIAIEARHESATVVWTDEIAQAWGVAASIMAMGDEVGARMAFLAAYERAVKAARAARRPLEWVACVGHDPSQRARAIEAAAASGRVVRGGVGAEMLALASSEAAMLEAPGRAAVAAAVGAIVDRTIHHG